MDEGTLGIVILIGLSIVVAMIVHWFYPRLYPASLIATIIVAILFQGMAYLQLGYLDPFFPIAVVIGGAISFAIALAIGAAMRNVRAVRARTEA